MTRLLTVGVGILLLAGCSAPAVPAGDVLSGTVTVLAAASLTETLDGLSGDFEAAHPGVEVVVSYGGSSALAAQIVAGAPADVFFSANESTMQTVVDAGLAVDPEVLLGNVLEIAVPAGNPGGVTGLADFADVDLAIALCDPAVPCGSAAVRLFELTGVAAAPDTLEEDVKAALAKVALGEVDAALVYRTDVLAAGPAVEGIEIPEAGQAVNSYPLTVLADAADPGLARAYVDFLRSAASVDVFVAAGFTAAAR